MLFHFPNAVAFSQRFYFPATRRRFGGRMSDLEDTVAESQIKLKTVDKYKFKIAELTKELRAYLDQVTTKNLRAVVVLSHAS